jgi:hypothetical protein
MTHADDLVIMGIRLQKVEEVFTWLIEQINKMRLGMSARKTEFAAVSRKALQRKWICRIGT